MCCLFLCVFVDMDASGGGKRERFTQILSGWSTKGNVQTDRDQRNRRRAMNPAEQEQEESKPPLLWGKRETPLVFAFVGDACVLECVLTFKCVSVCICVLGTLWVIPTND